MLFAILFWLCVAFLIYTYAGYPLLVALLAGFRSGKQFLTDGEPSVTLLITAYNEETVIEKKLENSLALDYPREKFQILVAADGSSDRTAEIVEQYHSRGVELNYLPERRGKMAAINRAMPRAQGDVIIFSDANNMYGKEAVVRLVEPFTDPSVGATTGAKLIVQDGRDLSSAENLYWKYESWLKTNETKLGSCSSAVGEMFAIRRELFDPPPANIINDDFYQAMGVLKRGHRVVYVPQAKSYEFVSATAQDEIVRRSRMNAGRYQAVSMSPRILPWKRPDLIWQIISHKYFRLWLPFGYLGVLVSNIFLVLWPVRGSVYPLLAVSWPFNWIFFSLQLVFYGLALLGNYARIGGVIGKALYLPTFLVNANISALRGFWGFATKRQSHVWTRVRRGNE